MSVSLLLGLVYLISELLLTTAFRIAHDLSLKEQSLSKAPAGENSDWQGDNH